MKIALISVYNKNGIIELSNFLLEKKYQILSTGGTAKYLKDNNIPITNISDYIKYPEILGGRVKTLHPKIFGGILTNQSNNNDLSDIKKNDISIINLVVVNFYPVEKVISEKQSLENVIENIDIGGVSLVRAAAKNFKWTVVLNSVDDYKNFLASRGDVSFDERMRLAAKAFDNTSKYDKIITDYFKNFAQRHREHRVKNNEH
jgi:phosphoribosylaminoimidazolecarboxamide formyltransferase / IMP cyclohydrolase